MNIRTLLHLFIFSLLATRLHAAEVNIVEPEAVGVSGDRLGNIN